MRLVRIQSDVSNSVCKANNLKGSVEYTTSVVCVECVYFGLFKQLFNGADSMQHKMERNRKSQEL